MAVIRKYLTDDNYTKADNNIVRDKTLSDQAKVLYWYMASHANAFDLYDIRVRKDLDWSRAKLARYKKELKDRGLIHIIKTDTRSYTMYIGFSRINAKGVMASWNDKNPDGDPEHIKGE